MLGAYVAPFCPAVELPSVDAGLETGTCPGNRQHRGDESCRADAANCSVCGQPDQRGNPDPLSSWLSSERTLVRVSWTLQRPHDALTASVRIVCLNTRKGAVGSQVSNTQPVTNICLTLDSAESLQGANIDFLRLNANIESVWASASLLSLDYTSQPNVWSVMFYQQQI